MHTTHCVKCGAPPCDDSFFQGFVTLSAHQPFAMFCGDECRRSIGHFDTKNGYGPMRKWMGLHVGSAKLSKRPEIQAAFDSLPDEPAPGECHTTP